MSQNINEERPAPTGGRMDETASAPTPRVVPATPTPNDQQITATAATPRVVPQNDPKTTK